MTNIISEISSAWTEATSIIKTLITVASDASPLIQDLKNLIAEFEGKSITSPATPIATPLEPTIAGETQATTDALNTPIK